MRHRIFIAINLPEKVKKELSSFQEKWPELPVRWVKSKNLHITLAFLGYLSDEEVLKVMKITREVGQRHNSFLINLKKICYGPPKKPARMIWAEGEKSKELDKIQRDLVNSLLLPGETRSYTPHITLGRIRQWEFRQMEPEERPEVNEEINLSFEVNSIEVMESQLKRGGAEYTVLESAPLANLSE